MNMNKRDWRIRILAFLPAAAWYRVIWGFSGQTAAVSGGLSDRLLSQLLTALSPAFAEAGTAAQTAAVELLSFFERKAAHMFLYFTLALLVCFALCFFLQRSRRRILFSALVCALLASLDEYHQTMVPGRSGEVRDVLVDLCGACIALGLMALPHLARWGRRSFQIPLPAFLPAIVCTLPIILVIFGPGAMDSALPVWAAEEFLPDAEAAPPMPALAPALWGAVYLAACGLMGLCAPLAALLAGAKPWMTGAAGAGAVLIAALLAGIAGAVSPLAAAGLVLLGELGGLAMWALGTILVPCEQMRK